MRFPTQREFSSTVSTRAVGIVLTAIWETLIIAPLIEKKGSDSQPKVRESLDIQLGHSPMISRSVVLSCW